VALAEWEVEALSRTRKDVRRARDLTPFSNLKYEIRIQRRSGYYVWKIFLTVFIAVAATMAVSLIIDRISLDNMAARLRIDRACRWVFPLVYLLALGLVIGQHWVS
jgi:hypothetical protein